MADRQDFKITHLTNATMSVPRVQVEGRLTDSQTGATLFDFTGANALILPNVLGTLTQAQRREVLELMIDKTIAFKAGLE